MEIYQDRDKRLYNIKFSLILTIVTLLISIGIIWLFPYQMARVIAVSIFGSFGLIGFLSLLFHYWMLSFKKPLVTLTDAGIVNYTPIIKRGFHAWNTIDYAIYRQIGYTHKIELIQSNKIITTIFFDSIPTVPHYMLQLIQEYVETKVENK